MKLNDKRFALDLAGKAQRKIQPDSTVSRERLEVDSQQGQSEWQRETAADMSGNKPKPK